MSVATITSKGQITLPKDIRDDLNLREGDRVRFEKVDGQYVMRPQISISELAGILHRPGEKSMTIEEMDEALGRALVEDDERIRTGKSASARRR